MNRRAYSLTQTLIPICILISVFAFIISTCVNYTNEQFFISELKIVYRELTRAYITTSNEYGNPLNWGLSNEDNAESGLVMLLALSHGMNDLKVCTTEICPKVTYKGLNKKNYQENDIVHYREEYSEALMGKKIVIYATNKSANCELQYGTSQPLQNICGDLIVDLNGPEKPNIFGIDTFMFYLTKQGIIPAGLKEDVANSFLNGCSRHETQGYGCAAWVLINKNMDYLHCDTLDWNNLKCET